MEDYHFGWQTARVCEEEGSRCGLVQTSRRQLTRRLFFIVSDLRANLPRTRLRR